MDRAAIGNGIPSVDVASFGPTRNYPSFRYLNLTEMKIISETSNSHHDNERFHQEEPFIFELQFNRVFE